MIRFLFSKPNYLSYALLLALILIPPSRADGNATLELYATIHSIGAIVSLESSADPDQDGTVRIEYRAGGQDFIEGLALSRIAAERFVGSLFQLDPATSYQIRITCTDPDGGPLDGIVMEGNVTTQAEPNIPSPTNTYYASPAGSGTICSFSDPCSLIQALQLAQPGDEAVLRGGVYHQGGMGLPRSGSDGAPIVIRGMEGESVILDGSDPEMVNALWTPQGNGVYFATLNVAAPHYVMADGQRLLPYRDLDNLIALSRGVPGFFATGPTLYVHLANDTDPNGLEMAVSSQNHCFLLDGRNFITMDNLTFRYYGQGSYAKAIYLNNASNNLIQNCVFAFNDLGIGIKRASHRNVIQDNQFYDAIFDWPWSEIKDLGELEDGGLVFYDPMTGRGTVIRRNQFHDDFDALGTSPANTAALTNETDVYENTFYNIGDDGISADGQSSNVRIWGNTFHDVLIGISLAPVYDGPVYAFRNLIYRTGVGNNTYPGSPFKFNSGYDTSGPMYLFHNTSDAFYPGNSGLDIKSPGSWANIHARNNIWSGTDYAIRNVNADQPVDLDYDGLYTSQPGELVYWGDGPDRHMTDLSTFQQLTGQELHGRACEPGFKDAVAGDYTLHATSCLIDKGMVIPGINQYYTGDAPDMGAFEYFPNVELEDAVSVLRIISGMLAPEVGLEKDFNGSGNLDMGDAIYILQKVSGLR